jgi:hypothetical protein
MSALDQVKKMESIRKKQLESIRKQSPTGVGAISDKELKALRDSSPTGIRPKTKRDGMKPCVKGNCGQKPLTGKTYKDYI